MKESTQETETTREGKGTESGRGRAGRELCGVHNWAGGAWISLDKAALSILMPEIMVLRKQ